MRDSDQQTLSGDKASYVPTDELEQVSFHYYESNAESILNQHKPRHKESSIEMAVEFLDVSSRVETDDMSEEDLEEFAEMFVDQAFSTVWEQVDGTGYSFWMGVKDSDDEFKKEYPLYVKSPTGVLMSSFDRYGDSEATAVSEAFLKAAGQIILDTDETNGWSNCSEDLYKEMTDVEKKIWQTIRGAFIGQIDMSPELVLLLEKGKQLNE